MNEEIVKARRIARQSQMERSIEYFQMCSICPSLSDLIKTTTMLEEFVINGYSKEMLEKFDKLDEYINKEYRG